MSQILTSIHGRKVGLDKDSRLVVPGGSVFGEDGNQFIMPSPSTVSFIDDFEGDVIADQWGIVEGTDSATSDAAILAGGIGGVLRITSGDAGTGLAADQIQVARFLQWKAANGGLVFQARIALSAITNCYAFIGFTDQIATLEAPIMSAGSVNTITTNATDAVGVFFDTRMSAANWWMAGVKADVDATHQNSGYAPVAATYETWRIEVDSTGAAVFFRNGKPVGTKMSAALTTSVALTPVIVLGKLSVAASMTADVDYVHCAMAR